MNVTSQYSTYAETSNTAVQPSTESVTVTETIRGTFTTVNATGTEMDNTNAWATELTIFEGINIALLVIVTWLLFNLIAYGIKTGRFRKKAQSSSLNSGMIYIACVLAVLCFLFRLIVTVMTHVARRQGKTECEIFGDMSTFGYGLSLYAIYMFLWLRQRLIYVHPFVRSKVNVVMNWISRLYVVFLTAVAVALMCVFLIPKTYFQTQNWCYENRPVETSYILGGTFFVAQALMLWLCIYPATRGSIQITQEDRIPEPTTNGEVPNGNVTQEKQSEDEPTKCCGCCLSVSSPSVVTSPVEMAIKRTVASSVLVVVTDIIAVVVEAIAFTKYTPAVIRQTTVEISTCIDLFWAVGTFGFALKVFTLFCPSCSRRYKTTKERTDNQSVGENTVDMQI